MRRALVLALAVPALFVLVGPPMASADHMLFGKYYWEKSGSGDRRIHVYLNDVYWKSAFIDAMEEWGGRTEFKFDTGSSSDCKTSSKYAHVKICDADYGNTGWGAIADVRVDPGNNHILGGRVRLNTYYRWDYHTARSAWCQEFGHILGLDHRGTSGTTGDDPDSCMSYHPSSPERPDGHDVSQLACQTVTSNEPKPRANCTEPSGDGGACILGIICFNTAHTDAMVGVDEDGGLVLTFVAPPPPPPSESRDVAAMPRSATTTARHLPHRVLW
ncbi:MAG: hypothetical protein ABR518_03020 [Actinomycetota bacterium]